MGRPITAVELTICGKALSFTLRSFPNCHFNVRKSTSAVGAVQQEERI